MSVAGLGAPIVYYRLINDYNGPSWALDVVPDGSGNLMMARSGNFGGQYWRLAHEPSAPNKYYIQNLYQEGYSLDIINDRSGVRNKVHLAKSDKVTGQLWTFTKTSPDGTAFRLSNDFSGPDMFLDVFRFVP